MPRALIAVLLIGCALVALGWAAWTRRWVRWAAWDGPPAYNAPITVVPALGLLLVAASTGVFALGAVAMLGLVAALALFATRPRWYGPRWYRDRLARGEVRLDLAASANVLADVVEGAPAADAGWWSRWGRGRVAGWWRAKLENQRGTLVLYRTALAWSALDGPADMLLIIPRDELVYAAAGGGDLVLRLRDGVELRFRAWRAPRAARRITQVLG